MVVYSEFQRQNQVDKFGNTFHGKGRKGRHRNTSMDDISMGMREKELEKLAMKERNKCRNNMRV